MKRLLTITAIALGLTFAAPLVSSVDAYACGAKTATTQKTSKDDAKKTDTKTKKAECKPGETCDTEKK